MKLTIFIGGLSGGGAERVVCNLANYLVGSGYKVEIITMSDDEPSYYLNTNVIRISLIKRNERKNTFYNCVVRSLRLRKYMKMSDTQEYLVMLPACIILLLLHHRFTKAPIVVSERTDTSKLPFINRFLMSKLVKYASGFVFQTEYAREWYRPYIRHVPMAIIPNAVNSEVLKADNDSEKEKSIVAVGRLSIAKNFNLLIDAFSLVHLKHKEYKLVIYGEGALREKLQEKVIMKRLEEFVELPGYVGNVSEKVKKASVFVLSSDYEGMPNALIEAMALGVPCVATDCPVGGPGYLIQNEKNGLLVPVGDVTAMADAVIRLLENQPLSEKLGANAKNIRNTLSPEVIYGKWEKFLFHDVVGNKL